MPTRKASEDGLLGICPMTWERVGLGRAGMGYNARWWWFSVGILYHRFGSLPAIDWDRSDALSIPDDSRSVRCSQIAGDCRRAI
jgi:hypothetical protein